MKELKLLVDLSSVLGAYLHIQDEEFGQDITYENKDFHIPDKQTCLERFQQSCYNVEVPILDFIVVKDPGGGCRVREKILSAYKKKPRVSPPEFYELRVELFEAATTWLKSQGAIIATPKNYTEADDLINELAIRLPKTIVWTRDKDLLACPTDVLYQDKNGYHLNPEKFPVPDKFIHLYRTIVTGDVADNVGSCKGFGPKAWDDMISKFGEDVMEDLVEILEEGDTTDLLENIVDFKPFRKMVDQIDDLLQIYEVLKFQPVPAHKVRWEGGMLKGDDHLVTSKNFDSVYNHIKSLDFDYAVMDYEGDVCQESRDWSKVSDIMVDVMSQKITGMGLRIHDQNWYFSTDHKDTDNISLDQLESVLELLWGKKIYAHNVSFENTLTYNHFGVLLPNMSDTMLMGSYVDESERLGLKNLSKRFLDYEQASYQDTLAGRSGMREVTGKEVLRYGLDDVITTDGIMRLFRVILQYEGTLDIFHKVEDDALYFTTLCFIHGIEFDAEAFRELKRTNDINIATAWEKLSDTLLDFDWEGGEFQEIKNLNMGTLNRIYKTAHGKDLKDVTAVKMAIKMMDDRELAELAENKDFKKINDYYRKHWKPVAEFNVRSPKQMSKLLYEVLKLPVRVRNSPTARMKKAGQPGNPASNEDAIQNAIIYGDTEHVELLQLLLEYKGYLTKESLFLEKYPKFVHWDTGKIHAALRQSATTTRRYSCSRPNLQQLPKFKGKEFRNMLRARKGYTLVALDFTGQELRIAADDSRDPNFLACYIGDDLKDPHSLTGLTIAQNSGENIDYDRFIFLLHGGIEHIKDFRTLGKKINFTCQYGAMAPKVALTLRIPENEAQQHINARKMAFPVLIQRVKDWHKICRKKGYATTLLGARRHLGGHQHYGSRKDFDKQSADRLAYSMRIQGSAAEMTKLAVGRMYRDGLFNNDDILPCLTIHDEVVVQVKNDLVAPYMPSLVEIMCQPYANMIVPMETEPEVGESLGSLKSWEKIQLEGK